MDQIDFTSWVPGVLAFIALQLCAFFLNILSNGATPIAGRVVKIAGTHWRDQRRNAAIERLALIIACQAHPHRELVRIVFFSAGLITSLVLMSLSMTRRLYQDAFDADGFWWGSTLGDLLGATRSDTVLTVALMLLASFMMLSLSSRMSLLLNPNRSARKLIRQLEKLEVSSTEAWSRAQEIADTTNFRPPISSPPSI